MDRNSENPKVSIIIPTYNSGETLTECLKSIRMQSYPLCEVIVVDNFSSDNTVKIATEFGAKIIKQKSNPALARNVGVVNSTGKYILFLDSDQVLSPSAIEECVRKCKNENVEMIMIPEVFIGKGFWSLCSATWKNCYEQVGQRYAARENLIPGEPRFFVKERINQVGLLDANLLWGEDYNLYKRLKEIDTREASCKSKLYHYEPDSIKKISLKNLHYGKSVPIFMQRSRKRVLPSLFNSSLYTIREVFRDFKKSPSIIVGCTFLLCLKACLMIAGLLMSLFSHH